MRAGGGGAGRGGDGQAKKEHAWRHAATTPAITLPTTELPSASLMTHTQPRHAQGRAAGELHRRKKKTRMAPPRVKNGHTRAFVHHLPLRTTSVIKHTQSRCRSGNVRPRCEGHQAQPHHNADRCQGVLQQPVIQVGLTVTAGKLEVTTLTRRGRSSQRRHGAQPPSQPEAASWSDS